MVKKPEIDRDHIVNKNKVSHLCARRVATVRAEEFDRAIFGILIELVERDTGHPPFVLLTGSIDIEIPKPHHLPQFARMGALKIDTAIPAHALVKQQLGVAVHVERTFKLRVFSESIRATVGGCAGGIQQACAALLTGLKQTARQGVVVIHHVLAVRLHRVAASAFVENSLNLPKAPMRKLFIENTGIDVVRYIQISKVQKFIALR